MEEISNRLKYKMGQVIWDNNYQKYFLVIGYDENKSKYLIDEHKIMNMSEKEIDEFKLKNYNRANQNDLKGNIDG